MHGRRRADVSLLSAEKLEGQRQKVRLGFELLQQLLHQRTSGEHTLEVLHATRKLIEFNPELSTIWNYRREVLSRLSEQRQVATEGLGDLSNHGNSSNSNGIESRSCKPSSSDDPLGEANNSESGAECSNGSNRKCSFCPHDQELLQLLREELHLTASGFAKGASKAYCLWLHRSWTLARLVAHEYDRHVFHLALSLPQDRDKSPADTPPEHQQGQQQTKSELHADCRCLRAPCVVGLPVSDKQTPLRCGLERALGLLQEEIDACEKIMKEVDARNFHCWQHRSMVLVWQAAFLRYKEAQSCARGKERRNSTSLFLSSSGACSSASLSRALIEFDFSNYSAWHLRSLLPQVQQHTTEEFEWLWQGLYTEPTDQSLWQYYTWLLTGSGGVRSGRLLAVREAVFASGVFSLFFFFAEPCALDILKCRVESFGEEAMGMNEVQGEWTLLSYLHTARVSGFTSTLKHRDCRRLSRVWRFTADRRFTREKLGGELCVHFAISLYAGPVRDGGSGIDAFHLQRLKCHAPQLATLASPDAKARQWAREKHEDEAGCSQAEDPAASLTQSEPSPQALLWKCVTLVRCNNPPEASGADPAVSLPWAMSNAVSCTGLCCACKAEVDGLKAGACQDTDAVFTAEAIAAAGGSLSGGLSLAVAQQELRNIDELLQLEPECKEALDAKLRLLRVLRPHAFAEYGECCSALMAVDAAHESMHRDEAASAAVREKIWKHKCQPGTLPVVVELEKSNIERLPYPLLLEATDVQELSLRDNPLTNEAMLDWHVPYLPHLRRLDIRGTKISRLSFLLLSVAQLPLIERVDAAFTQLSPGDGTSAQAGDEDLKTALQTSTLMEIEVTATPLAASLGSGSVIYSCFQLVHMGQGAEITTPSFLRRL